MRKARWNWILGIALVLWCVAVSLGAGEPKLKAEDVLARHLDSIGSAEARAATRARVAEGTSEMKIIRGGQGRLDGVTQLHTEEEKLRLSIAFDYPQYRGEEFAFDGKRHYVGTVTPGMRSRLGEFMFTYGQILSEGLLGGALSTAWPLGKLEQKQPELKYAGLKKVDDRLLHRLDYRMKKASGDPKISLYFEPETFRHVMTVYSLTLSNPTRAGPDLRGEELAGAERQVQYTFEERFSDFRAVDGLTLPHQCVLRFTTEMNTGSGIGPGISVWEWGLSFQRITHNAPIDPKTFVLGE